MARKPANAAILEKEPTGAHRQLAAYIMSTTAVEVDPEVVGLVLRLEPLYRKTPQAVKMRETEKREREAAKAAAEAAKNDRLRAKLADLDVQRQRLLDQLGVPSEESLPLTRGVDPNPPIDFTPAPKKPKKAVDTAVSTRAAALARDMARLAAKGGVHGAPVEVEVDDDDDDDAPMEAEVVISDDVLDDDDWDDTAQDEEF